MAEHRPIAVRHVDLADGLPDVGASDRDVLLVLWSRGRALGHLELNRHGLPPGALADRIAHVVARTAGERLLGAPFAGYDGTSGLPAPEALPDLEPLLALGEPLRALPDEEPPAAPPVTLAICTRGRPEDLDRCLRSVLASGGGWSEILVVDNEPSPATRAVVEAHAGVRYLAEPRPGLSAARNAAVAAARGEVIAFVDDDTEVQPGWLPRLCADFADPAVMAVTGLVLPAALDTPAQVAFERDYGGFNHGYQPLAFDAAWFARTRRRGAPAWKIGAGANMAVRMTAFELVGGFDERLGAGAAGCSEDSELWHRLVAEGWVCRYQPASVVFHHHRRDREALRRQARLYLQGHVAALFVQYGTHRNPGDLRRALVAIPRHQAADLSRGILRRAAVRMGAVPDRPLRPLSAEVAGYAGGLLRAPAALRARPVRHKAPLRTFLRANPFPHPLTEGFFYREKMRAIHRVAPDRAMADVLEVGGGRSGLARLLYPEARITNIDLDPSHAEAAVNADPRISFMVADATALPFPDQSFDAVTLFDVLEHIPDDRAAAAEAWRVLRPGGWILMSSPNLRWRSPYHRAMAPLCPDDAEMMARWGHVRRGYDHAGLAALFGARPASTADFINPVTAVCHDLAFSRLPERVRRGLAWAISPVTWAGYAAQPKPGAGTETAAAWRKPDRA